MREKRWRWWRDKGSQKNAHSMHGWDETNTRTSWAVRCVCKEWVWQRSPSVSRHCRASCALCWTWFSRCHWCRTSHRSARRFFKCQLHFTTHKQFHVQSSFLQNVAVRFWPVIVNSICIPNSSFSTFCEFLRRPPGVLPLPPGRGRTRCRLSLFVLPGMSGHDCSSPAYWCECFNVDNACLKSERFLNCWVSFPDLLRDPQFVVDVLVCWQVSVECPITPKNRQKHLENNRMLASCFRKRHTSSAQKLKKVVNFYQPTWRNQHRLVLRE